MQLKIQLKMSQKIFQDVLKVLPEQNIDKISYDSEDRYAPQEPE